ncbi:hypothetical protein [Sporanaerobacter sp. PP17-6a]|uniref:hypothetical protein n=1 Tax=Sporanaerobacter sp. PP17-6a TaxID=1891289 RepID=UPI0008A04C0F|nr:hypothetical protein [Sporanaerobacter sp. PP17-6a]SCL87926.1 hypothetical protein PP176A_1422 [Sporanaerobacter sp. PP17-6a]
MKIEKDEVNLELAAEVSGLARNILQERPELKYCQAVELVKEILKKEERANG